MVLESTMICVDNSEFMRNGDFLPTRLQAQQDAVNMVCHSKSRANPENNVGLLTMASTEVLVTLTTDTGRVLSRLHQVQPKGVTNFVSAVRIAHLALKHRQGKNHKMRIVVFVASPLDIDEKEVVRLAKKLKKEKVSVDVINFGEEATNTEVLSQFINTINGKDGTSSHLVTVPPGPHLSDALISSPVIQGEDGSGAAGLGVSGGFEFGVDPNEDPELALALRVSMEEQRQRQEDSAKQTGGEDAGALPTIPSVGGAGGSEEAMLEKALAMSMEHDSDTPAVTAPTSTVSVPDFSSMSEEDQIAYAMQMSMHDAKAESNAEEAMETDEPTKKEEEEDDDDYSEVVSDPAFLQSVLENLPGVDPQSEDVKKAMGSLTGAKTKKDKKGKKDEK